MKTCRWTCVCFILAFGLAVRPAPAQAAAELTVEVQRLSREVAELRLELRLALLRLELRSLEESAAKSADRVAELESELRGVPLRLRDINNDDQEGLSLLQREEADLNRQLSERKRQQDDYAARSARLSEEIVRTDTALRAFSAVGR